MVKSVAKQKGMGLVLGVFLVGWTLFTYSYLSHIGQRYTNEFLRNLIIVSTLLSPLALAILCRIIWLRRSAW
jgi:hypothetical protein